MNLAEVALRVREHHYQDAVRRGISALSLADVDVLAGRRSVPWAEVNARGVAEILTITETPFRQDKAASADVEQARSERTVAEASLADAREALLQRKRILAARLNRRHRRPSSQGDADTPHDRQPPTPALIGQGRIDPRRLTASPVEGNRSVRGAGTIGRPRPRHPRETRWGSDPVLGIPGRSDATRQGSRVASSLRLSHSARHLESDRDPRSSKDPRSAPARHRRRRASAGMPGSEGLTRSGC